MSRQIVLGSGSPRRRELLSDLIGSDQFIVDPPAEFVEPECDAPSCFEDVTEFVEALARKKGSAVWEQRGDMFPILSADTIVVAGPTECPVVLGKPPETTGWQRVVRDWWKTLLSGRPHQVLTGVAISYSAGNGGMIVKSLVAQSTVTFREIDQEMADWYLNTEEPIGKAGGYAIQGLGSVLVESVQGSLSNVIGLPLWETRALLIEAIPRIQINIEGQH